MRCCVEHLIGPRWGWSACIPESSTNSVQQRLHSLNKPSLPCLAVLNRFLNASITLLVWVFLSISFCLFAVKVNNGLKSVDFCQVVTSSVDLCCLFHTCAYIRLHPHVCLNPEVDLVFPVHSIHLFFLGGGIMQLNIWIFCSKLTNKKLIS